MRNFNDTVNWLQGHRTTTGLGFNPDGQCLKVARLARGIPQKYGSAKQAQDATPEAHRVHKVADLRKGMVLFFDDPNDSNHYGHIVTMIGRVKGGDVNSLHDVLVVTNSVKSGTLQVVRADYFPEHWGDKFQFGATQLNGVDLDYRGSEPKPGAQQMEQFDDDRPRYHVGLLDQAANAGRKVARETRDEIDQLVKSLPKDEGETRVARFKQHYHDTRILRMGLLKAAVVDGRDGKVKDVFDRLMQLIRDLPDH